MKFMSLHNDEGWVELAHLWFSRLFVTVFPVRSRSRIIDLFLLDGVESLYKMGLILLDSLQYALVGLTNGEVVMEVVMNITTDKDLSVFVFEKYSKLKLMSKNEIANLHSTTSEAIGIAAQPITVFHDPKPSEPSLILKESTMWHFIYSSLPTSLRPNDPVLLYRASVHGYSANTLMKRGSNSRFTVLLVKNDLGEVFGGFGAEIWARNRNSFGSRYSFVFSIYARIRKETKEPEGNPNEISNSSLVRSGKTYQWSPGKKDSFQLCNDEGLGFGSAFFLMGQTMEKGSSIACDVFCSPQLTWNSLFDVVEIELWSLKSPKQ
jgi:hypothetical protein